MAFLDKHLLLTRSLIGTVAVFCALDPLDPPAAKRSRTNLIHWVEGLQGT